MRVLNPCNYELPVELEGYFERVYQVFLSKLGLSLDSTVELEVVDPDTIKKLNREYRSKDLETDVLSFPMKTESHETFLGSIYFCYPVISRKYDDVLFGFCFLFAHSLLHLVGYEHCKEMFDMQDEIVSEVF